MNLGASPELCSAASGGEPTRRAGGLYSNFSSAEAEREGGLTPVDRPLPRTKAHIYFFYIPETDQRVFFLVKLSVLEPLQPKIKSKNILNSRLCSSENL